MYDLSDDQAVEILDNGVSIGRVPIMNGQWSWTADNLGPGSHRLTARCKGLDSLEWNFTVGPRSDFDDFESARVGDFQTLERGFFTVVRGKDSPVQPPAFRILQVTDKYQDTIPTKKIYIHRTASGGQSAELEVFVQFNEACSSVVFECFVEADGLPGTVSQVIALNAGGQAIPHSGHDFLTFEERKVCQVQLPAQPSDELIKTLLFKIDVKSISAVGRGAYIFIDNLKVVY